MPRAVDPAGLVNLASAKLGAEVVHANDEFFGDKARLISDSEPVFIDGKYDEHGKWMDGWETRRKRGEGHDHCIVRLARPGTIRSVVMDTTHFTGNYPPEASLEACHSSEAVPGESAGWRPITPLSPLKGNTVHEFVSALPDDFTHVRLNIFPDGGMARLKIHGEPVQDWEAGDPGGTYDLAARLNGGRALYCNDEHFGSMHNLIAPGRGVNMGDGWETRRRREPGNDYVVLKLGTPGVVSEVVVDTAHFKGNYPDRCSLKAAHCPDSEEQTAINQSAAWAELMPAQKLGMDQEHTFGGDALRNLGAVSHVRMDIFPDGGVSRLRLLGTVAAR